jgi:hypothetical protein
MRFILAVVSAAYAASATAESRLPPNQPGSAINAGTLDVVRQSQVAPWRLMPCVGYTVDINFANRFYNTRYLRFGLAYPGSRVTIQMIEDPPGSLWFELLDNNLVLIQEYRGGEFINNQRIERDDLPPGQYFVRLVTNGSMQRRPDGTNRAFVVLRALPLPLLQITENDPKTLGSLERGQRLMATGTIFMYQRRAYTFEGTPQNPNCPTASGTDTQPADLLDRFRFQAPPGTISTNVRVLATQNWPSTYPYRLYLRSGARWVPIQNEGFQHSGGQVELAFGHVAQGMVAQMPDAYVGYQITVSLSAGATIEPPAANPGVPETINLGPRFRGPRIEIGPIPRR